MLDLRKLAAAAALAGAATVAVTGVAHADTAPAVTQAAPAPHPTTVVLNGRVTLVPLGVKWYIQPDGRTWAIVNPDGSTWATVHPQGSTWAGKKG